MQQAAQPGEGKRCRVGYKILMIKKKKKNNPALENNFKLISTLSGGANEARGAPEINPQTRTHDWAFTAGAQPQRSLAEELIPTVHSFPTVRH